MYRELVLSSWGYEGDSSSPVFTLPQPLYVSRFKILSVQLPLTAYSFDEGNNVVLFAENNSSVVRRAQIEPGTYNSYTIQEALASALNAVGEQTYTVKFLDAQRSLEVSGSSTPFKLFAINRGSTAGRALGLDRTSDISGKRFILPNQLDLSPTNIFLLKSTNLTSRYSTYVRQPSINCLAVIAGSGEDGTVVN